MRIVLKIPRAAYAELAQALEEVPVRERAERVRFLAAVGMAFLKPPNGVPQPFVASQDPQQAQWNTGFNRLRDRLKQGME